MKAELEAIREQAAADKAAMEVEREELKQLKLDAIGNTRGKGSGSAKSSPTKAMRQDSGSRPRSATMFGGLFSSSRPASAKGFSAGAVHDSANAADAPDRPVSAAPSGSSIKTPDKGNPGDIPDRPASASFFGSVKMFSRVLVLV